MQRFAHLYYNKKTPGALLLPSACSKQFGQHYWLGR